MAQRPLPVTPPAPALHRRRLMRTLAGAALAFGSPGRAQQAADTAGSPTPSPSPVAADPPTPMAEIAVAALPAGPLELHVARVVVPAGVALPAATPSGVRLFAVDAGALAVELAPDAPSGLLTRTAPPGRRLVVPAGRSIALAAAAISGVGSAGLKPAVFLDAAVFHAGERPPDRAFTTEDGVGFQVLAGGGSGPPPAGACAIALGRMALAPGERSDIAGVALVYAEAGTGWAANDGGAVRYARSAAQAPGSTAGPWRPLTAGRDAPLTAGSAILAGRNDRARVGNDGQRPLRLLLLTVFPAADGAAG